MAANMQHMAGAGGMMPQHRPRLTQVQLNQYLYQSMLAHQQPHSGWQAGVTIQERMIKCHNLITNIALAVSNIDFMKAAEVGVNFEREAFNKAPDKPTYEAQISNKTNEFFRRRQANEQNLSNNLQAQAAAQAQQQIMMNQNSAMQNQMGRGMGQNPQQGFQHLQHQMQASQIPQQAQMGVNMGNQGGQPIGPNQQMFQMAGGQARPQNVPTDISSLTPADQQKVMELAQKMAANAHEQQKNQLRAMVTSRFAQRAQEFTAQGKDPVLIWFQHQAFTGLTRNMNAQRQRMQQAGIPPNMNPAQAQAMMQAGRGQMNPAMPNAAGMQGGNGDFGQFNAMESIMNQQKAGILAQEQGQMVVPASNGPARNATPQPMTAGQGQGMPNAAGPNQTPRPPQAQQQQLSMQQAQQLKMEQQQSQHAAQMRAQQQARQLQGQPNGLGGAPPSQSPGMNTLNTPMRRPPSAMNPMEAQGGGQASGSFAGTLDPRFNQGNQRPMATAGNMNLNNNPVYHSMMASFNDQQRQAVQTLPPDKLHEVMSKWQEQQQQRKNIQMGSMQQAGNNMQGRQFNMPNAGNPLAANGMMPQQGQPGAPNQQAMMQQQQMLARLRNQAAPVAPAQQAMMDSMDMPPPVLAQIGSSLRAPPEMRKWKDLRQWLAQNPVNPQIMGQLEKVQRQQFVQYMQKSMERRNQQMQAQAAAQLHQPQQPQTQQQMQLQQQQSQPQQQQAQQQGQPQGQPLMQNGMQAGNAGSNQPPSGLPQGMPPNMPPNIPQHLLQVTQQEIIGARKTNPKIASLTDDQLRQFIIQIKQRNMANAMQKDMAMRQAQGGQNMQVQGSQNGPVPAPQQQQQQQPPPLGQPGGPQLNAAVPTPAPVSQPAQSKQTSATPDPKAAANAAPARNNSRPAPNNQQQPPNPSPATAQKNLKRPSTDDAIDVPQTAPQQQPQRPIPTLTAEQIKNLTPAQKAQYELIKSRQQAMAASNANVAATETDFEKLRRIGVEEQKLMATEHMPDIQMSPEQRQETAQKLMRIVVDMGKIGKALGRWYAATRDDARAKSYFRARLRMIRQFTDGETMTNPKPVFSVGPAEIDEARRLLESMARDCASLGKKAGAAPPQQGGQAPTPTQSGATPSQGGQPAPLSAANLEKQTQALNKMHGRSNSKSGGPPAAPTTSQPPFSFGATSPHGQPAYIGKPKVNRENLTLPPRKKTKTDNTPPQPSQATPSPQISKSGSPELKRQEPPKPMFQCPEPDCDTSRCGFPSEQALHAHIQEDHVKPREDPMKFAQENLALALGLDANGQAKMEPQAMAQPMVPNASKQARTPASNAAATPMSRDASMQRTGSKIGGKPQDNKASVGKLEDTPKLEDKQPDMTVVVPAPAIDPWANTVDPASLFTKVGGFEFGLDGTVSNMAVYRSLTPNDTPESSKDSGSSEPNSDISEGANLDIDMNWHPIDVDLLLDMNNINMDVADVAANSSDAFMLEDDTQMEQFTNWDEVSVDFSKPYQFDNSLYSLDVS